MMKYLVIKSFTDLQDDNRKYRVGDVYPRSGLEVSDSRLKELSTTKNRRGVKVIEAIKEEEKVEEKIDNEVVPTEAEVVEKPKRERKKKNAD